MQQAYSQYSGTPSAMLTIVREPGNYSLVRPTPVSVCGFTFNNKLECIDRSSNITRNRDTLLEMVNGELELLSVEILNAKVYEFGVELFFEKSDTSFYSVNILSSTEIFRDSVYLTTTENGRSYIDR